ncbi:MAG: hypothetical protein E7427_00480 [Ruminococcaceae bacterium]|nr:hypothetical protein [Oscillospiraceae bacterium]
MKRSIYSLFLVLLLVIIVCAAGYFILRGTPSDGGDSRTPGAVVTPAPPRDTPAPDAPQPTAEAPIETRAPLETPEVTAPPEPTAPPTPAPTPTPAPADAEGSFRSDTGMALNLKVDWKTYKAADGTRKLQADVSILSYSIFTSAQYRSITLKLGDKSWSADCAGISYDGKDQIATPAASFTVDAPAPGTTATVSWYYGGSYSGKDLDTITASGTVG